MLLPRVLTALIGAPLLLILIHLGSWPFLALCAGTAFLSLYEYGLMLRLAGRPVRLWMTAAGGTLLSLAVGLGRPGGVGALGGDLSGSVVAVFLPLLMACEAFGGDTSLDRAALSLFGVFFIGWTLAHLALLRDLRPFGEGLTYLLFLTLWISDSAAYFAGRSLGSRRLAPKVSPQKTWEGAAAGFAAAVAAVVLGRELFLTEALGRKTAAALGVMIGIVGPLSDLAESVVKRAVGAKDSSSILPGHGGVLDRFDSFLLTAPLMYYALILSH